MTLLLIIAGLLFNFAAFVAEAGTISGKVVNAEGAAIQDVSVSIYTHRGILVSTTETNEVGEYLSEALEDGAYRIATFNRQAYIDQIYPNEICGVACFNKIEDYNYVTLFGGDVIVDGGNSVVGINFQLNFNQLNIQLVDENSGELIESRRWDLQDAAGEHVTFSNSSLGLIGLPLGMYFFSLDDLRYDYALPIPLKPFFSHGLYRVFGGDISSVSVINLDAYGTHNKKISVMLRRASLEETLEVALSGTVRFSDGRAGKSLRLEFVKISSGFERYYTNSNDLGNYRITLSAGAYKLSMVDDYIIQCVDNLKCNQSKFIQLTIDSTTVEQDIILVKGATITGRVVNKTGDAVVGGRVVVYGLNRIFIANSHLNFEGKYTFKGVLRGGSYLVCYEESRVEPQFVTACSASIGWAHEDAVYQDKKIELSDGGLLNFNIVVSKAAQVSGYVYDALTLKPIENVSVGIGKVRTYGGSIVTNSEGYYSSKGQALMGGVYKIRPYKRGYSLKCKSNEQSCLSLLEPNQHNEFLVQVEPGLTNENNNFFIDVSPKAMGRLNTDESDVISGALVMGWGDDLGSFVFSDPYGRFVLPYLPYEDVLINAQHNSSFYDTHLTTQEYCDGLNCFFTADPERHVLSVDESKDFQLGDITLQQGPYFTGEIVASGVERIIEGQIVVLNIATGDRDFLHIVDNQYMTEALVPGEYVLYTKNENNLLDVFSGGSSYAGTDINHVPTIVISDDTESSPIKLDFHLSAGYSLSCESINVPVLSDNSYYDAIGFIIYDRLGKKVSDRRSNRCRADRSLSNGRYFYIPTMTVSQNKWYLKADGETVKYGDVFESNSIFDLSEESLKIPLFQFPTFTIADADVEIVVDYAGFEKLAEKPDVEEKSSTFLSSLSSEILIFIFFLLCLSRYSFVGNKQVRVA